MLQGFVRIKWTLSYRRGRMEEVEIKIGWSTDMKKIIRLGLVVMMSILFAAGCKEKDKADDSDPAQDTKADVIDVAEPEAADAQGGGTEGADQGGEDGIATLSTDDRSISITVVRPEGYEIPEYSSEFQVVFQRMGENGENSMQMNLRLVAESESEVMAVAQQEVGYILSANGEGAQEQAVPGEVQTSSSGARQWSYFTYSTEGLEGVRAWSALSNGCVISCIAENLGSGLEPLNVESILQTFDAAIQE